MTWSTDVKWWFVSLTFISHLNGHVNVEMVMSILYLGVLYSPNLHELFIMTWSTDVKWWFVSLTFISHLNGHVNVEMVMSILYLGVLYSPNLHELFIMTWSTRVMWWFVSLTFIGIVYGEMVKSILQYLGFLHSPNLTSTVHLDMINKYHMVVSAFGIPFILEWTWLGING